MSGVSQMFHPHLLVEVPTMEPSYDQRPHTHHSEWSARPDLREFSSPLVSHASTMKRLAQWVIGDDILSTTICEFESRSFE